MIREPATMPALLLQTISRCEVLADAVAAAPVGKPMMPAGTAAPCVAPAAKVWEKAICVVRTAPLARVIVLTINVGDTEVGVTLTAPPTTAPPTCLLP